MIVVRVGRDPVPDLSLLMPRGMSRTLYSQRDHPLVPPLFLFEASFTQDGIGWPQRPPQFRSEDDR